MEMEQILRQHAGRYPLMEPTDAVKLIYQNVFGGGHLVRDAESCLQYLRREHEALAHDPAHPLTEPIGNGIVRVHLAALDRASLEQLGEAFLRSSREHTGTQAEFLQKLETLRRLTEEGIFAFDPAQLDAYLSAYAQAGYPMVSHSTAYRAAYGPAYRVVLEQYFSERPVL